MSSVVCPSAKIGKIVIYSMTHNLYWSTVFTCCLYVIPQESLITSFSKFSSAVLKLKHADDSCTNTMAHIHIQFM
jgi:hypothetical protein